MFQFAGFPPPCLCVRHGVAGSSPAGSPHSGTRGSMGMCPSPRLFAACRAFRRLLAPRHPPCALLCLTDRSRLMRLAWRFLGSSRASRPAALDTGSACRTHGHASPRLPAVFLFARCPMGSPPSFGSLRQYSVFKVQLAAPAADGLRVGSDHSPSCRPHACAPGRPLRAPESCLFCMSKSFFSKALRRPPALPRPVA